MMLIQDLEDGLANSPEGQLTGLHVFYSADGMYKVMLSVLSDKLLVVTIAHFPNNCIKPDEPVCVEILDQLVEKRVNTMDMDVLAFVPGTRRWLIQIQ